MDDSTTIPVDITRRGRLRVRREAIDATYAELDMMQFTEYGDHDRIAAVMNLVRNQRREDNDRVGRRSVTPVSPRTMRLFVDRGIAEPVAMDESRFADPMLAAGVGELMGRLTPAQRDAVRLCWIDRMSTRDAARALNVTQPAIVMRLRTAQRVMRGAFESDTPYAAIKAEIRAVGAEADAVVVDGQRPSVMPDEATAIERIDAFESGLLNHECDVICRKTDSRVAARASSARVVKEVAR